MKRAIQLLTKSKVADRCLTPEQRIVAAWPLSVSPVIARHTLAATVADGVLIVEVEDKLWQRQLEKFRHQIVAAIHKTTGGDQPKEIKFRLRAQRLGPMREEKPVRDAAPADEADAIADPFLGRIYKANRKRATG
ncbi:MAG: DciA family protein [Bryobacteraceae bacterium]